MYNIFVFLEDPSLTLTLKLIYAQTNRLLTKKNNRKYLTLQFTPESCA